MKMRSPARGIKLISARLCSRCLLFRQVVQLNESLVIILSSHFSTSNPFCACRAKAACEEPSVIHADDLCFKRHREFSCAAAWPAAEVRLDQLSSL
jgi:hypothetical protein